MTLGFSYGAGKGVYDNGTFKDKSAFISFTTGGPQQAYGDTGKNGQLETILFPIHHGVIYFNGFTVYSPFISYSPARISDEERQQELKRYRNYLSEIKLKQPIYRAV